MTLGSAASESLNGHLIHIWHKQPADRWEWFLCQVSEVSVTDAVHQSETAASVAPMLRAVTLDV